MLKTPGSARLFAPEVMTKAEMFHLFYSSTYNFGKQTRKKISGLINHLRKSKRFEEILLESLPKLLIDKEELNEFGVTTAKYSNQIACIFESQILELYSALDCLTSIIHQVCKTRGLCESTRRMFTKIRNNQIDSSFPNELKVIFDQASWYDELLFIRDELTHSDTGGCHYDAENDTLKYYHEDVITAGEPLKIDDALAWIRELSINVNKFSEHTFEFLCSTLLYKEQTVFCGIFLGRPYMRSIGYTNKISSNSGVCISKEWFDSDDKYECPLKFQCRAYSRDRIDSIDDST